MGESRRWTENIGSYLVPYICEFYEQWVRLDLCDSFIAKMTIPEWLEPWNFDGRGLIINGMQLLKFSRPARR